jgi:hypothetical protein
VVRDLLGGLRVLISWLTVGGSAALGDEQGARGCVRQREDRADGPDRLRVWRDECDQQGHLAEGGEDDGVDGVVAVPGCAAAGLAEDFDIERVGHAQREQAEQQRGKDRVPPAGDRGQGGGTGEQGEATDGPDVPSASLLHNP